jgi:MFS family permease
VAAAALLGTFGWRATLVVLAGAYAVLGAVVLRALPAGDGASGETAGAVQHVDLRGLPWADPRLWTLLLAYAAVYAWITSIQLHFHAYQTDLGRSTEVASRLLAVQIAVGALGAPLFGWLAERTSARSALVLVVAGLGLSSIIVWTAHGTAAFAVWAVVHGLVNSGVVALLALVLHDLFDPAQIGRLMGVASVFCMSATILGNQFSAWIFDRFGSYVPAWRTYTVLMALALVPIVRLRGRGTRAPARA